MPPRRRRIVWLAFLPLASLPGAAFAQARADVRLRIVQVGGTHRAGDPIPVTIELATTAESPVTVHFDRRQLALSLRTESAAETLCEPATEPGEARRRDFVTIDRRHPRQVHLEVRRHCPDFAPALERPGACDLRAVYEARLDGWQWGLRAWTGRLLSEPSSFVVLSRFGARVRGTAISQRVLFYADTDDTVVLMPQSTLTADVAPGWTVGAAYLADIVSSASVDVATSATRRLEERRDQMGLGVSWAKDELRTGLSFTYSSEPDFESAAGLLSASADLLEKNLTVSGEAQLRHDRIGVRGDDPLPAAATSTHGRADVVQLVDPRSFLQVGVSGSWEHGMLSNPYRFVATGTVQRRETMPEDLRRLAVAARFVRLLAPAHGLRAEYRFYLDDWGVVSHTAELKYLLRLGEATVRLGYRFYRQGGADFYDTEYPQDAAWFTGDRELGPLSSHGVGLELGWSHDLRGLFRRASLEGGAEVLRSLYDDFPALPSRTTLLVQLAGQLGF